MTQPAAQPDDEILRKFNLGIPLPRAESVPAMAAAPGPVRPSAKPVTA